MNYAVSQRPAKFRDRVWLHILLFALTIASTTLAGAGMYVGFRTEFGAAAPFTFTAAQLLVRGLWYSGTILLILGCHELGHYLACRYYDVDASLPYFIPLPLLLTGTMGAFIRIREPIPRKAMLFDIGIAGPIAGFLVAVPALIIGIAMSNVIKLPETATGLELGEPLLFKAVAWVFWGSQPDGYSLNMHPMAFAAWFGLLATALNLFPIAQLDGGHISYSVLGRWSTQVTYVATAVVALLTIFATSWAFWAVLMLVMLRMVGAAHPPVIDEAVPLDRQRMILALFALVMFILCFTPTPIQPLDLIRK